MYSRGHAVFVFVRGHDCTGGRLAASALRDSGNPPYATYDEAFVPQGVFVDVLHAFADLRDWDLSIRPVPTKRLVQYIQSGEVDCTIYIRTAVTQSYAEPVANLGVNFNTGIIARKAAVLNQYEDLKNLKLGVSRGTVFGHKVDTDPELNRLITNDYGMSARLLKLGRVDAILGVEWSLLYNLRQIDMPDDDIGSTLILDSNELWFFCSRQSRLSDATKQAIRADFATLRQAGTIQIILDSYLNQ